MKMITHRGLDFCANLNMNNNKNSNKKKGMYCGLDCCASLNIGCRALLALHGRAPVGASLQQLLFHNLVNPLGPPSSSMFLRRGVPEFVSSSGPLSQI